MEIYIYIYIYIYIHIKKLPIALSKIICIFHTSLMTKKKKKRKKEKKDFSRIAKDTREFYTKGKRKLNSHCFI
jgi:hypothetical protein